MGSDPNKTTIEITNDVWTALDYRKDRGDSFNDVIIRLINNTTVPMGSIKEASPDEEPEWGEITHLGPMPGELCAHYDIISGESCDVVPEYGQDVEQPNGDPDTVHWCEEHVPEGHENE